ncbi:unnamed protein product [Gordionus sp. m RMFG-2023]
MPRDISAESNLGITDYSPFGDSQFTNYYLYRNTGEHINTGEQIKFTNYYLYRNTGEHINTGEKIKFTNYYLYRNTGEHINTGEQISTFIKILYLYPLKY